jgi:hypothetical protein
MKVKKQKFRLSKIGRCGIGSLIFNQRATPNSCAWEYMSGGEGGEGISDINEAMWHQHRVPSVIGGACMERVQWVFGKRHCKGGLLAHGEKSLGVGTKLVLKIGAI